MTVCSAHAPARPPLKVGHLQYVVLERLGISQVYWDKMLDAGVPYSEIGHSRWITGDALFRYIEQTAKVKSDAFLQLAT
jgi:hypothetical protein